MRGIIPALTITATAFGAFSKSANAANCHDRFLACYDQAATASKKISAEMGAKIGRRCDQNFAICVKTGFWAGSKPIPVYTGSGSGFTGTNSNGKIGSDSLQPAVNSHLKTQVVTANAKSPAGILVDARPKPQAGILLDARRKPLAR